MEREHMQFTPLHRLLGRAPAPLSDEMIDDAVSQGIAETDDLDWKSKLPPAKGMAATDYPKDIAAMANSRGGMIVYGITEEDKKATGPTRLPRPLHRSVILRPRSWPMSPSPCSTTGRGTRAARYAASRSSARSPAWHHRQTYRNPGPTMRARWAKVDPALKARGHAGNRRHQQWCQFLERKKNPLVANVAIARQLAGWCWSLATVNQPPQLGLVGTLARHLGEVCELDLRYSYEPQRDSLDIRVTPVPREQPPFAPNHRIAVPNPRISV
jgi:hypothetical protein